MDASSAVLFSINIAMICETFTYTCNILHIRSAENPNYLEVLYTQPQPYPFSYIYIL